MNLNYLKSILTTMAAAMLLSSCHTTAKSYDSYTGLVMAGYQGWFNAPGDGTNRGFYHYKGRNGFRPGSASVDFWPDVSEYEKTYETEFVMPDGSKGRVYSAHDESTVDTHFRWMKEYGLDGVFMQRFVGEAASPSGKHHFNHVLDCAMKAAHKYERAICVMYDLSGMRPEMVDFLLSDIDEIDQKYHLHEHSQCPSYLYHNGCPMVAVWGMGFNDGRRYTTDDCEKIVQGLKKRGYSVMIGVPTHWRELVLDTKPEEKIHEVILQCDVVMPWFVGRYNEFNYPKFTKLIAEDMKWCEEKKIDYAPLIYPGFSWHNMKGKNTTNIPRNRGAFLWAQIEGAYRLGAKMLYVAMFDEIDEGTAIFKAAEVVPVPQDGSEFVPIEAGLGSDFYLKMIGRAAEMIHTGKAPDATGYQFQAPDPTYVDLIRSW